MDLTAGFVLVGGRSSRMGRDKALLRVAQTSLVERTAELVRAAAGSATLIGAPERYAHLGIPAMTDVVEGRGPLGGVLTALTVSQAEWNLIVACDMPGLTAIFLGQLLDAARSSGSTCLVPESASGLHPLCAVYRRHARPAVETAIAQNFLKMHDILRILGFRPWAVADASLVRNVNTPADWEQLSAQLSGAR